MHLVNAWNMGHIKEPSIFASLIDEKGRPLITTTSYNLLQYIYIYIYIGLTLFTDHEGP
jgi:hypothetical protein